MNWTVSYAQICVFIQIGVTRTVLTRNQGEQSADNGKEPGKLHDDRLNLKKIKKELIKIEI